MYVRVHNHNIIMILKVFSASLIALLISLVFIHEPSAFLPLYIRDRVAECHNSDIHTHTPTHS